MGCLRSNAVVPSTYDCRLMFLCGPCALRLRLELAPVLGAAVVSVQLIPYAVLLVALAVCGRADERGRADARCRIDVELDDGRVRSSCQGRMSMSTCSCMAARMGGTRVGRHGTLHVYWHPSAARARTALLWSRTFTYHQLTNDTRTSRRSV